MKDCIIDSVLDSIKILPYLLITFLILEYLEHKLTKNNEKILSKSNKFGPLFGGLLGCVPQCGFGVIASNLFSSRVITTGTLIAIFLSTSDEMLPIMISEKVNILLILKIIGFKMIVGIIIGFIIDLIYRKTTKSITIDKMCKEENCDCEHEGILLSSIKHALKIGLFILIANLLINIIIFYIGEENLSNLLLKENILSYFISSLVGLIPNCASSVIITKLYLSNFITVGTMLSGLLTGSGIGILLLFKTNKNLKENITILSIVYIVGVIVGFLVDILI